MYNGIENVAILPIFILNQYTLCSIYCTNIFFFLPLFFLDEFYQLPPVHALLLIVLPISRVSPPIKKLIPT